VYFEAIRHPTAEDMHVELEENDSFLSTLNSSGNELRRLGVDVDGVMARADSKLIRPGGMRGYPLPDHRLAAPLREALAEPRPGR
jgi:hypothetical protein